MEIDVIEGLSSTPALSDGIVSSVFMRRRRLNSGQSRGSQWAENHAEDLFIYEMLTMRDVEKDALLWQAPSLALTAQAFLLTIALNADSSELSVLLSAGLGMVVAGISMQLMAKHRMVNLQDRAFLHYLEGRLGLPEISWHNYFYAEDGHYRVPDWFIDWEAETERWKRHSAPERTTWLTRASSYTIWIWALAGFGAVNLFLFGYNLILVVSL